ncbi:MAG TPA: hypothetical protein VFC21_04850 [Bryobacteraceae bacterium]|nr:hypothetical protein [Bryobacteraceae bacterium]
MGGRLRLPLFVLTGCLSALAAETGFQDPEFKRFPFERWQAENKNQIHWNVSIPPPELSRHQRLIVRVIAGVDGKELEKRRGAGEFISLIQYRDSAGHVWQNHTSIDLAQLQPGMQRQYLDIVSHAFVLPGDYTISVAICDSRTLEHSVTARKVHVDELKSDPLPGSWAGLPPVEFVSPIPDPPDAWYMPEVATRLNLTLNTKRPVNIRVLLNTTPSQRAAGSVAAMRANMSLLIPALKILSGIRLSNGTLGAELLDLTHRRVTFEQSDIDELNWRAMREFFLDNHPGIIDAASLQGQWKMRKFFWDEVSRGLAPGKDGAVPIVIVLSGPAFLEDQEFAETAASPGGSERRLFYIRYRSQQPYGRGGRGILRDTMMGRGGGRLAPQMPVDPDYVRPMPLDDLEHTVEPLNARVFDATSATQFRRILAAVLEQISRL